jgi:hypothetical protein
MLDTAFLEWLRATTEARWADPSLRDIGQIGLGEPTWQPGTRWRGGLSASDLEIVEAMFSVRLPAAYRLFVKTLHTPDPPLAATQVRGGRIVRVEQRLFTDWAGDAFPIIAALERPLDGLLRGVALGRWHPVWGERPVDEREWLIRVRHLAGAARLIPLAGQRYLVALPGRDDGPVLAIHGADASIVAPDLRSGLLRELGLEDRSTADAAGGPSAVPEAIPFWSEVVAGVPWLPRGEAASA